jgi:hypothetical protein
MLAASCFNSSISMHYYSHVHQRSSTTYEIRPPVDSYTHERALDSGVRYTRRTNPIDRIGDRFRHARAVMHGQFFLHEERTTGSLTGETACTCTFRPAAPCVCVNALLSVPRRHTFCSRSSLISCRNKRRLASFFLIWS